MARPLFGQLARLPCMFTFIFTHRASSRVTCCPICAASASSSPHVNAAHMRAASIDGRVAACSAPPLPLSAAACCFASLCPLSCASSRWH
eukprot:2144319-Rhodomonas_salina.1